MTETVVLHFDVDRLTLDDWITIEDFGSASARNVRDFLAHLAIDPETREPLPEKQALAAVGKMTRGQLETTMQQFVEGLKASKEQAVSGEASGS